MYVIIVYDISTERVNRACKFLREYLNWIQNSVFEGEVSESQMKEIEIMMKRIIKEGEDSVIIYKFRTKEAVKREVIGMEKTDLSRII